MTRVRISVVKVGGSLLTLAELPPRLRAWLAVEMAAHPDTHFVLLVGGGKWVDAIREIDRHTPLGEERAHWVSVSIMDVTAGLLSTSLPELTFVSSYSELEDRLTESGVTLLRPSEFVERIEPLSPGTRLPANWSVTSDSIAARLAIILRADELVLLKSAPPPVTPENDGWLDGLAAAGYVDKFLPTLRDELPAVQFCELPIPKSSS